MIKNTTFLKKRRIISKKECLFELKDDIAKFFEVFYKAVDAYNGEIKLTPIAARPRNLEANLFLAKLLQIVVVEYPHNWTLGSYKRFVVRIDGCHILNKILYNKDMSMNITSLSQQAIGQQQQFSLFLSGTTRN